MIILFMQVVFTIGIFIGLIGVFKTLLKIFDKQGTIRINMFAGLFYFVYGVIALICLNYAINIFISFDRIVLLFFCVLYLTVCAFIGMVLKNDEL